MDGLFTLLALSVVMAIASFLAGMLPLSISLSRSQLRLISTVGMGVLVGTSMIVIIPEGVETLYNTNEVAHSRATGTPATVAAKVLQERWEAHTALLARSKPAAPNSYHDDSLPGTHAIEMPGPVISDSLETPPKTPTEPGVVGALGNTRNSQESDHHDEAHHAWIGVALISGFILMFLIDKLPQTVSSNAPRAKTQHIALNSIGRRFNLSNMPDIAEEENEGFIDNTQQSKSRKNGFATTTGLVIHAAADGIALGASSSASHTGLSLVIFFAIMIHKAPAAFGLTTVLLRQGLTKRMVRAHLVLFSLAAPVGAILTWMVARLLGSGAANSASSTQWWTGVLLLFSGGTFLYVAVHSMQEVTDSHHNGHAVGGPLNGSLGERRDSFDHQPEERKSSLKDLGAAVFGMILPLFLQVGHAH